LDRRTNERLFPIIIAGLQVQCEVVVVQRQGKRKADSGALRRRRLRRQRRRSGEALQMKTQRALRCASARVN